MQPPVGLQLAQLRSRPQHLEPLLRRVDPTLVATTVAGDLPGDHRRIPAQPRRYRPSGQSGRDTSKNVVTLIDPQRFAAHPAPESVRQHDHLT